MAEFAKCRDPNCWFLKGKHYHSPHCHPVIPIAPVQTLAQRFNHRVPCLDFQPQAWHPDNRKDNCHRCGFPRNEHSEYNPPKHLPPTLFVDVVMSGFPDHTPPQFIELENEHGHSIKYGEWIKRADGQHVLRLPIKGN